MEHCRLFGAGTKACTHNSIIGISVEDFCKIKYYYNAAVRVGGSNVMLQDNGKCVNNKLFEYRASLCV